MILILMLLLFLLLLSSVNFFFLMFFSKMEAHSPHHAARMRFLNRVLRPRPVALGVKWLAQRPRVTRAEDADAAARRVGHCSARREL